MTIIKILKNWRDYCAEAWRMDGHVIRLNIFLIVFLNSTSGFFFASLFTSRASHFLDEPGMHCTCVCVWTDRSFFHSFSFVCCYFVSKLFNDYYRICWWFFFIADADAAVVFHSLLSPHTIMRIFRFQCYKRSFGRLLSHFHFHVWSQM